MINNIPYLTGGIFFSLLLEARKPRNSARKNLDGKTDGLSEPEMMRDLLYVVTGEKIDAEKLGKDTSQYKTCSINSSTYISFDSPATKNMFDENIKKINPTFLNRMSEFIQTYIDVQKYEWLVKTSMETIYNDSSIDDEHCFLVSDCFSYNKHAILTIDYLELEYFLIGILHFILVNRPNNTLGRQTFEKWHFQENNKGSWKFSNHKLGQSISHEVKVETLKTLQNKKDVIVNVIPKHKTPIIFGSDGIAPDLSVLNNGDILYVDSDFFTTKNADEFDTYISKATKFYSKTKTLLYSEAPRNFKDFYVCNDLCETKYMRIDKDKHTISNASITSLVTISKHLIICGTGGIGKSMMMKHLFFDCAAKYKNSKILPILIPLKNYKLSEPNLLQLTFKYVNDFDSDINISQIQNKLKKGQCVLFLDGYDELSNESKPIFNEALSQLIKAYPNIVIIISSRPINIFIQMGHFTEINILPFNKEKALLLIDKLEYHDVEAKAKFRHDLKHKLFKSHREFTSNPLLLTIMLMTYSIYGEIPAKQHIFYSKAYEVMSRTHDSSKGAFVRPMNTKLTPEEFAIYFSEFCARTYKDSIYEFTRETFTKYMDAVIRKKGMSNSLTSNEFILDLTENLCIMYQEGASISFLHRSFQEYFTAVFFSQQMDDKLYKVKDLFDSFMNNYDRTFDMLYDMIPSKIERFVFLPMLQNLWDFCDKNNGYWTFLEILYPNLYAIEGSVDSYIGNIPNSYLYNFFTSINGFNYCRDFIDIKWPNSIDYCTVDEYVFANIPLWEHEGELFFNDVLISYSEWQDEYSIHSNEEPIIEGKRYRIDIENILTNRKTFSELINFIENDNFLLKKEYIKTRKITRDMIKKYSEKNSSDDWFDDF